MYNLVKFDLSLNFIGISIDYTMSVKCPNNPKKRKASESIFCNWKMAVLVLLKLLMNEHEKCHAIDAPSPLAELYFKY